MRRGHIFSLQILARLEQRIQETYRIKTYILHHIKELDDFKSNSIGLVRSIKYKNLDNIIQ